MIEKIPPKEAFKRLPRLVEQASIAHAMVDKKPSPQNVTRLVAFSMFVAELAAYCQNSLDPDIREKAAEMAVAVKDANYKLIEDLIK